MSLEAHAAPPALALVLCLAEALFGFGPIKSKAGEADEADAAGITIKDSFKSSARLPCKYPTSSLISALV
jgi:hypothetical protein